MQGSNHFTITANRQPVEIDVRTVLYVHMSENMAEFHISGGDVYRSRMTMEKVERLMGEDFMKIHRSWLVSVMAIHDITDKVNLNNGERLNYAGRQRRRLAKELQERRQRIIDRYAAESVAHTDNEFHERFRSFDDLPIAFADIEMVMDSNKRAAVDWIFRYGNEALAKLEKMPLEKIIGARFSDLFPNMDEKWLRSYERAAMLGQTLEIVDHSPEIDTYLDIICFPTMQGHCGCILLDTGAMNYAPNTGDAQNARLRYFAKLLESIK